MPHLALESAAVAVVLVCIFSVVHAVAMRRWGDAAMTDHRLLATQVAASGVLFHVGFEVAGLNAWYCSQYQR